MIRGALDRVRGCRTESQCAANAATILAVLLLVALLPRHPIELTLLVLGLLVLLAILFPSSVLLLVPMAIPFTPLQVTVGSARFAVSELAVCIAVVGTVIREGLSLAWRRHWLQQVAQAREIARTASFASLGIGLLAVGTASLGVIAAPDRWRESVREWRWVILEPVMWYAAVLWVCRRGDDRLRFLAAWIGATTVASVICFVEWLAGGGLAVDGVRRLEGFYPHPNAAALALERAAIVALALALFVRGRPRALWAVAAAVIGLTTLLTFSRGAFLALAIASVVAAVVAGYRRVGFVSAALATVALAVGYLLFPDRLRADLSTGSEALRLAIWRSTAVMLADYPVTGVGLDQYLYQYVPRYVEPVAWPERFTSHPHNLFLDAWVRLGVAGLILVGCALWLLVRRLRVEAGPITVSASFGLLVAVLHGLVDRGYFTLDLALSFWLVAVILDLPRVVPSVADVSRR
ncbi:O-antigen ligase family protein [Thermomicrobium sp. 4228-Ro]|uniref:O-antigen ligase family protein n=1 Tax=Thermomicrobium sp. 4228-Ro TaxID=2993937 RepID=UPI00224916B4|nr:O-antigen ligase family protein [Thermomicrobium sp. 4228-Ro]MCX2726079.1 O-antigen ligase family protein [Thermomicrobium sp. 4228-Ro]